MVNYKLVYFDARGIAEPIRYLFVEAGVPFEDVRLDWLKQRETLKLDSFPFGTLPILEVDGKVICQSHTICQYLGKIFGLTSKDEFEQAQACQIAESIKDWLIPLFQSRKETEEAKKDEIKQNVLEKIPFFMKAYEKILGDNEYIVGNKCTWIDFVLAHNFTFAILLKEDVLNEYPTLKSYFQRVTDRPKIKEWIAKRPETEY